MICTDDGKGKEENDDRKYQDNKGITAEHTVKNGIHLFLNFISDTPEIADIFSGFPQFFPDMFNVDIDGPV
jgi:hypothetical protein